MRVPEADLPICAGKWCTVGHASGWACCRTGNDDACCPPNDADDHAEALSSCLASVTRCCSFMRQASSMYCLTAHDVAIYDARSRMHASTTSLCGEENRNMKGVGLPPIYLYSTTASGLSTPSRPPDAWRGLLSTRTGESLAWLSEWRKYAYRATVQLTCCRLQVRWKPTLANNVWSSSKTAADEVDGVQMASIHLECASMRTRIIFPLNCLAKSRCSLTHGLDGHFQGLTGASGGEDCTCWHSPHHLTDFSMSEFIPGHDT